MKPCFIQKQVMQFHKMGNTPYQIAGLLKLPYQTVIDTLRANDVEINPPTVSKEDAHEKAEKRHRIEDHQRKIREEVCWWEQTTEQEQRA